MNDGARKETRRNKRGRGLIIGAKSHLLVDTLDLTDYNTPKLAELVGIRYGLVDYLVCYTPNSKEAPHLINALQRYMLANPDRKVVFMGDFNVHNSAWIKSVGTDAAGEEMKEMCEIFGFKQWVKFPTRGDNCLDLIMCAAPCECTPVPSMGSSDHVSIRACFEVHDQPPDTPASHPVYVWSSAPWDHIRAALKHALKSWDPRVFKSVQDAELHLDEIFQSIISKYVKVKRLSAKLPAPWWDFTCARKLKYKCKRFGMFCRGEITGV